MPPEPTDCQIVLPKLKCLVRLRIITSYQLLFPGNFMSVASMQVPASQESGAQHQRRPTNDRGSRRDTPRST